MASTSPASTNTAKRAKTISTILGILYSIVVNGVLPFIIYSLLKSHTNISDFWALVASGVPPTLDAIIGVIRKGHVDFIAAIVLLSIAVSIVLILLGGSPRLYLIRESFFTVAFGLVYLASLLFPRPLVFYFARQFATGNVPQKVAWFNSLWQYPKFRYSMRLMTAVWGVGLLLEAAIRTFLVFTLTIPQFLIISPFVLYGFLGTIALWTILYSRKGRKRAEATLLQNEETSVTPTAEGTVA